MDLVTPTTEIQSFVHKSWYHKSVKMFWKTTYLFQRMCTCFMIISRRAHKLLSHGEASPQADARQWEENPQSNVVKARAQSYASQ